MFWVSLDCLYYSEGKGGLKELNPWSSFSTNQISYIIPPTQTIPISSDMIDNDQKDTTVIMVQNVFFFKKMGFFDALKAEQVF